MCHNFLMHTVTKMKRVTDKQIQLCTHTGPRSTCMQLAAAGISRQKGSAVPGRLGIRHGRSPMGIELPKNIPSETTCDDKTDRKLWNLTRGRPLWFAEAWRRSARTHDTHSHGVHMLMPVWTKPSAHEFSNGGNLN